MARFVTGDAKTKWACIDPDSRCESPRVCELKLSAFVAPYRSEEEAVAALLEAGAVLDVIEPPRRPR